MSGMSIQQLLEQQPGLGPDQSANPPARESIDPIEPADDDDDFGDDGVCFLCI